MDHQQNEDHCRRYNTMKSKMCLIKHFFTCQLYLKADVSTCCSIYFLSVPEAQTFGTMLVAYGYIYPLQNHKKLVMCNDASLYRFQVKQNLLFCCL